MLARTIDQTMPDGTDEWPHLLVPGIRDDDPLHPSGGDPAGKTAFISPSTTVRATRHPAHPSPGPRLRCMIATGTLNLGGSEMVALFLARGLPLHGLDTIVAHTALARSGKRPAALLCLDGLQVVNLSQRDVPQWLETHRPDVISMHGPPDWFVAAAAEAEIPSIETLHGAHSFFDKHSWPRQHLRSRQITGFVAVSEPLRRHYLRANPGYPPDRIITIPNGVDDQHINHRDRTQAREGLGLRDEFLFVSLARYTLQKNTFGLVTAFAEVARAFPEAHLLLAGDVADRMYFEQVRRLRDRSPFAGRIHLRGPCPDVSAVLAAADAFVLDPYFEAGFPLASMEALCAGVPVVISEVAGAREQMGQDGHRGFVVGNPLGDPEAMDWHSMARARFGAQPNRAALVEAMFAVVTDRDHWRDAREELRIDAATRFSPEVWLQRHAEVLTRAAAGETLLAPVVDPA
jgi:glycosyltransferase involved in cell wall biosynthesis